jgi:flagellar assembly protein FliH
MRDVAEVDAQPFTAAPLSRTHSGLQSWSDPAANTSGRPATDEPLAECARLAAENIALAGSVRALEAQLITVRDQAFEAGRRQGEQHAQSEFAPISEKVKRSIADTICTRADARHSAERDVVELALQIARRILHRELATDPTSLAALAKVVFQRMARAEAYTLTIHPQFLPAVQSVLSGSQSARVKIDADPACSPGTFIIKSAEGTIDASIDTQLEEISRGLADRLSPN